MIETQTGQTSIHNAGKRPTPDTRRRAAHRARHTRRWQRLPPTFVSMNITSTITSNPDRPMIPSEASGKRKASDDHSANTNGAAKAKRPRNDVSILILSTLTLLNVMEQNSTSNKRKRTCFVDVYSFDLNTGLVLNGEEQRSGLVIIRGSQPLPPSSQPSSNGNALAGPSQPPNKKFREAPTNVPASKGKHKSPDDDGVVEEDVRRMEMETDALRRAANHSRDPLPGSDTLLPLAPRETPKIEQNRAMRGEGSRTPRRASMSSRGKRLSNSFDRTGVISTY